MYTTNRFGEFTVHYLTREEWDVQGRGGSGSYLGPQSFHALVPHHSVTPYVEAYYELAIDRMRFLQNLRPDLSNDVPYNFVVFGDPDPMTCWVAEGRGIGWSGAHTYGLNSQVHAVCFWGNSITDPVNPGIYEGMRFVGRMMIAAGCPVDWPTLDHGSYPNQGTGCAGTKIKANLDQLQPPFLTPGTIPNPTPVERKKLEVAQLYKRPIAGGYEVIAPGFKAGKLNYVYAVVPFSAGAVDAGDEITVTIVGPNRAPVTVGLIEGNGNVQDKDQQDARQAVWGSPVSFVTTNSGWTTIFIPAGRENDVLVEYR